MQFDWVTFAFQLVNVLVLLAILKHFLFKPVAAIIARRREETQAAMAAAESAKAEALKAKQDAQAAAQASEAARHDVLSKAQEEAEQERKALLDAARKDAARILAEAKSQAQEQQLEAQGQTLTRARMLAEAIADRALAELPSPPDAMGYARRLADALAAMPPAERTALLGGGGLKLVAPQALDDDALARIRDLLAPLGVDDFVVEMDSSLVLGLELQSQSGVLHNSLAHDLTRISEALSHGDGPGA